MGRGRAKAKQTKVARRLKYYSPDTDLSALEQELRGSDGEILASQPSSSAVDDSEFEDTYRRGTPSSNGDSGSSSDDAEGATANGSTTNGSKAGAVRAKPTPPPSITPGSWMKKQT